MRRWRRYLISHENVNNSYVQFEELNLHFWASHLISRKNRKYFLILFYNWEKEKRQSILFSITFASKRSTWNYCWLESCHNIWLHYKQNNLNIPTVSGAWNRIYQTYYTENTDNYLTFKTKLTNFKKASLPNLRIETTESKKPPIPILGDQIYWGFSTVETEQIEDHIIHLNPNTPNLKIRKYQI